VDVALTSPAPLVQPTYIASAMNADLVNLNMPLSDFVDGTFVRVPGS
jgi:hypothetical protein